MPNNFCLLLLYILNQCFSYLMNGDNFVVELWFELVLLDNARHFLNGG